MSPHPEHNRLDDQLHKYLAKWSDNWQFDQLNDPLLPTEKDSQVVDVLVALARRLQAESSLRVNPDFARQLEQCILLHHVALRRQQTAITRRSQFFLRPFVVAYMSMAIVLLCSLLGTGVLAFAAQTTNPNNPLYTVKKWEQQVQLSLAHSPSDQAQVSLQIARDQLNTLAYAHGETYRQALIDLNGQIDALTQILKTLPAGSDRQHLTNELTVLNANARQVLRDELSHLSLSERLLATDELGQLGDTITQLDYVLIVFSASSPTQATISLTGNHFYPGDRLLIDQVLMGTSGTLQNGTDIFIVNWNGQHSPHTVGLLNPDGTVVQTTIILLKNVKNENNKNGQIGNGEENMNGSTHTNNNSNGANANKQGRNSQNGNATSNGASSHGHKNNET